MAKKITIKPPKFEINQVFLGVAIGIMLAAIIISVISFFTLKEFEQENKEKIRSLQQQILDLNGGQKNYQYSFPD